MIWSGDGGSVGIGYVYLDIATVELFRRGLAKEAIDDFLRFNRISLAARRILGTLFARIPADFVVRAMKKEIDLLSCVDPGIKPYIFLLLNDQRRHLSQHFESIDLHRTELHLPLLDSAVLELMIRIPIEEGLYHKFYHDMMIHFPGSVRAVPWQVYPGHLPCPLPVPHGLTDQWQPSKSRRKRKTAVLGEHASRMLRDREVSSVLDKKMVCLASLTTKLGMGDRSYLCEAAATVYRVWKTCGASVQPSPS
jgi:hypothetical protein